MEEKDTELRDEGLRGNEKIEEAIAGLQQEPTQEMLAHALTVVRRRMKENGQLIVAVEPPAGGGQLLLQTVKTSDGKLWWAAFTGFEEELRGSDRVKSTFLADMGQLFATALQADGVEGIILNPWNRTLMLEKELIRIIARLGNVIGMATDPETEIVVDFDDSIIEDKQAERQSDRQDVSMGVMSLAEYRAKWYGETEEQAKAAGYDVITALVPTDDKAHYYPDASFFITKLIADRQTRKLLGIQVFGPGAVDKMVDSKGLRCAGSIVSSGRNKGVSRLGKSSPDSCIRPSTSLGTNGFD